jgi:methionyl-tRNA formyltransferase
MRVVYMGTPDFAVKPLKALLNNNYDVVGVFTQPDKPVGRKAVLTPPPVKVVANENNIPILNASFGVAQDNINVRNANGIE